MTDPPRITIWHPTGPEGEGLANLIRGVLPEADVHLGPVPSLLRVPLRPDPALVWQVEGHRPTIRRWREAAQAALGNGRITPRESRRERRRRLGLHWWQRERRDAGLELEPGSTIQGGPTE